MLPATFLLIWPKWQHDTCYENYSLCNLSHKLLSSPSWKLTLSLHTPASVCLSLYLFSLVDFSLFPTLPLPVPDNFPQMAHQKRFIERKYRQELKEMRRERERQEKGTDEAEECRKWQRLFRVGQSGPVSTLRSLVCRCDCQPGTSWKTGCASSWSWSYDSCSEVLHEHWWAWWLVVLIWLLTLESTWREISFLPAF